MLADYEVSPLPWGLGLTDSLVLFSCETLTSWFSRQPSHPDHLRRLASSATAMRRTFLPRIAVIVGKVCSVSHTEVTNSWELEGEIG